ncbi:hypothetical protein OR1_03661 [Geobacter sp. OR-1]|uniref:hypothetical protein n=1 Tax=Geobacter sp. OR-1 TaxID=1266765 RepID=UPI000541E5D2|nr:hypothetical protein [Geobacter sp. OR-1]GAM11348.1 hypothetical protein OR1_03661 [Geobacter sp. OR-1]
MPDTDMKSPGLLSIAASPDLLASAPLRSSNGPLKFFICIFSVGYESQPPFCYCWPAQINSESVISITSFCVEGKFMVVARESVEANQFELIPPEEFIHRLGIAKSTLHLWRSKGWLLPGRHYIKIGSTVLYFWSEDRIIEIHQISNHEHSTKNEQITPVQIPEPTRKRINWDY